MHGRRSRVKSLLRGLRAIGAQLRKSSDKRKNKQIGLVGLAYAFVRYGRDAEFHASKNGVDADALGFVALGDAAEALVFSALVQAQGQEIASPLLAAPSV